MNFKKDFMEGIVVLKSHPWLWITILVFSFINICYAGVIVVLIPWLFNVHHHFEPFVYGLVWLFWSWCCCCSTYFWRETEVA